MKMVTVTKLVTVTIFCVAAGNALAHPLAPALLQLQEVAPQTFEVLWRTSAQRVQLQDVTPQLPPDCAPMGAAPGVEAQRGAVTLRWSVRCGGPLAGQTLRFEGLQHSRFNVIVRIEPLQGAASETLLDSSRHEYTVPEATAAPAAFPRYFGLGVEHLLTGLDHLLFVTGLFLLVSGWRRLLLTVTAFTLGHSLTLALATLGYLQVNAALTEFGIAISILALACALANGDVPHSSNGERPHWSHWSLRRKPWNMAAAFGLLHGLGFAGALSQVGLPADAIPPALLGFNLGIEAGQVGVIVLLSIWGQSRNTFRSGQLNFDSDPKWSVAATYVIGTLAAYWCFERAGVLLG